LIKIVKYYVEKLGVLWRPLPKRQAQEGVIGQTRHGALHYPGGMMKKYLE
jgi:hypothetical protein